MRERSSDLKPIPNFALDFRLMESPLLSRLIFVIFSLCTILVDSQSQDSNSPPPSFASPPPPPSPQSPPPPPPQSPNSPPPPESSSSTPPPPEFQTPSPPPPGRPPNQFNSSNGSKRSPPPAWRRHKNLHRHPLPPPPPPKGHKYNTGKKTGLLFAGIAAILQIGVVGFLVFKRNQLLRVKDRYETCS